MKTKRFITVLLIMISMVANAQKKSDFTFFTDRDTYASGEPLFIKIFTPPASPSQIVCLDLVNLQGIRITGISLKIKDSQADGFLQLPDSLSSGTYLVRAYLKNTAPLFKAVREIWISNRFDGLGKTSQESRIAMSSNIPEQMTSRVTINGLKPSYQTNESVDLTFGIDQALHTEIDGTLMICIAQDDPAFESNIFEVGSDLTTEDMTESKGIILSGIVTDKKNQEPASGITVYLTIPDSVPGFQYYQTQPDGRFHFLIDNYYGAVQAVIQCFGNSPTQRLKIKLDERFAQPDSLSDFRKSSISEELKASVTRNINAVTFRKVFGQDKLRLLPPPKREKDSYPYYGKPSFTVDPQLFIDLPDFTEISRELLPGVKFRNYNNEPTLQVLNSGIHNYFDEQPLILIDGIPVRDLNLIKNMSTADIDRIEVCQSERFFGNLRFPGVVAIYTTKADYTRIPESDQLIRIKLETIQLPFILEEPELTTPNIPDLRQVIYWNPVTKPDESFRIKCRTSSVLGHYKLVIRGRLKDGTFFYTEKKFEVN